MAQGTHESVLVDSGALQQHETLRYGAPVPAGPTWAGVFVDDHLAVQLYKKDATGKAPLGLRDEEVVKQTKQAYKDTKGLDEAEENEITGAAGLSDPIGGTGPS